MKSFLKFIAVAFFLSLFTAVAVLLYAEFSITKAAKGKLYNSVEVIPYRSVAVVPGTSKYTVRGTRNLFYQNRLDAVFSLYEAGKISHIIASGDNRDRFYDEPRTMKADLVAMGVPSEIITRDTAGVRTYESVLRAKTIFGADSVVFVSQAFQNQRAIYIARHLGVEMIGYNAENVSLKGGFRTYVRERFARILAVKDVIRLKFKRNMQVIADNE